MQVLFRKLATALPGMDSGAVKETQSSSSTPPTPIHTIMFLWSPFLTRVCLLEIDVSLAAATPQTTGQPQKAGCC